ncbi:N-acetylmuramoyl-L-alanine amidase [Streptomyces sp. SBT349]|uniref:N-acetylmuramoyl-L-alanine amidase n=1 Tax=Streptomyces sp. SBT349 TaxID=1580539 RepID=UPI00066DFE17|nr:peptidoglycan recognition family protein [Streptomyces sp. SBT349]
MPPSHRHASARRALLRGGAAVVATAATMRASAAALPARRPNAPTGAGRSPAAGPPGFPGAEWTPADASNLTAARRPLSHPIDHVVIHVAQETYRDTIGIFADPSREVSAHYVVAADGRVAQCVADADIGWHAGNWGYNTRSIGIEHEGWVDEPEWFTDAMYAKSAALTAFLCATYGIPGDRSGIIGHHEVPGATHTDPGPLWDWDRYLRLVNSARATRG